MIIDVKAPGDRFFVPDLDMYVTAKRVTDRWVWFKGFGCEGKIRRPK
jgi:hypothetical protein